MLEIRFVSKISTLTSGGGYWESDRSRSAERERSPGIGRTHRTVSRLIGGPDSYGGHVSRPGRRC